MSEKDVEKKKEEAMNSLQELANDILDQVEEGEPPSVQLPTRTKNNIVKDGETWRYGDKKSTKSSRNPKSMKKILQYSYLSNFIYNQIDDNKSSTLREIYYLSESWDNKKAKFNEQSASDQRIEELEIITDNMREDFNVRPEEDGASIIGPIEVEEDTKRGTRKIHCQKDIGEGGYQIPTDPDEVDFVDHDAEFILAVETGGMRDRLVENGFDEEFDSIVCHLKGQPARATRRIIHRMNDELDLPVITFADGDPWSYRIYGSVRYGSINSAYLSKYLATPTARYLGITPKDIKEYDLPSDDLSSSDENALENLLDDPRFATNEWEEQIKLQLEMDKKAEQQSLASGGLDFVTDTYLPEKLDDMDVI